MEIPFNLQKRKKRSKIWFILFWKKEKEREREN